MAVIQLLESSQGQLNLTGVPRRVDSWCINSYGWHTIAIYCHNFTGRVYIEVTLAMHPTEEDWFPIHLTSENPFIEFPINPVKPTGDFHGDTGVEAFTFQANIVWARARIDRSYISHQPRDFLQLTQLGVIKQIVIKG